MFNFDQLKLLDPVNRIYLEAYHRHLSLAQLKDKTIYTKMWKLYAFFKFHRFQDTKQITNIALEDYVIYRRKNFSPITVNQDITELKLYFRWLLPGKEQELFGNIKQRRIKPNLPVDQLITREDIQKLVDQCQWQRDRALFMLMWDSAARVGELTGLDIGHVQFDQYGAVIIVDGKTGRRRLRLVSSVPDLQQWLNVHPRKNDPTAPLFITIRDYGKGQRRLDLRTIENSLKLLARKAGIKKRVHPHGIRHARLTDLARGNGIRPGLNEMELRLVAGWERNSAMAEVYVHLSGADVERKILANAGIIKDDVSFVEKRLEPVVCPRCKTRNSHDSQYCTVCSMVLNEKVAVQINESLQTAQVSSDYATILAALKRDLGIKLE